MSKTTPVFMITICVILLISLVCSTVFMFLVFLPGTETTITELNQTYNGSVLDITATDIQIVDASYRDKDRIYIEVRFIVNNTSKRNYDLAGYRFNSYVDDVTAYGSSYAYSNDAGEDLSGTIAPGKSAVGYYSVYASKGAKKVEIHIEETDKKTVIFILDMPPVG